MGFEASGCDVVAAVELDPVHCAVHKFNFPLCHVFCEGISGVKADAVGEMLGARELDVIVGGPPCQGFSQIGYRQLEDPRNRLVFEYCRLVQQLRPKYFVFENVPGMTLGAHHAFVEELLNEFEAMGYCVASPLRVLDALEYGVPQSRKRFIILGHRKDCPPLEYPAQTHNGAQGQLSLFDALPARVVAEDAIGDLETHEAFTRHDSGLQPEGLSYEGYRFALAFEKAGKFALCDSRTFVRRAVWGHLSSQHSELSIERFSSTPPGSTELVSRFFKLHRRLPCNTLRAGTDTARGAHTAARPIHYELPRCITIREGMRLHSYPDWFQLHRTVWHGFRQLGNSVAPLFAKALGDAIVTALGIDSRQLPTRVLMPGNEDLVSCSMTEACDHFGVSNPIQARKRGG